MTVKVISESEVATFDSDDYPWCIVSSAGYTFYQTEDLAAYQTAMLAIGITIDDSGFIVVSSS